MTKTTLRLLLPLATAGVLLLGACSKTPTRPARAATAAPTSSAPARTTSTETGSGAAAHVPRHTTTGSPVSDANLPKSTGIAACDDYLASYKSCHKAAGIYAPDSIEGRYQQMRRTLLRDSADPDMRPQLENRCNSLAGNLKQALHGKSCASDVAEPASTGSSGT